MSLKLSTVADDDTSTVIASLDDAPEVQAVAHRVVHGGMQFSSPVVIDENVERELRRLTELAPLHNTPALEAIGEARRAFPSVPQVAVFDTGFHATLPERASTYAVPRRWREEWGIRRYGFHGLSVQWAAERVRVGRLVVCHLGGGCSVTAVLDGRSVETTMGFSPLEGVPMATRPGTIDPEVVPHLLRTGKLRLEEIEHALQHESGLLALGGSSRVEELERRHAGLALDVFTYRVACAVGAAAVALGGLEALVFTAGVGEGSARVRADVCAGLAHLGVELDDEANRAGAAEIAASGSRVRVAVVHAQEDVVAARAARTLLGARRPSNCR